MLKLYSLNESNKKARWTKRASGGPYEAKYYCILVKPFHVAEVLTMG